MVEVWPSAGGTRAPYTAAAMDRRPLPSTRLPKISVVTPCLDAVHTIGRALDSVREQAYPDVEHIVIDGGSTDGTLALLEARPHVQFVSEPDEGLSDALNKGVAAATGDLVGWLNADDWYQPGALLAVGESAANHPEALWFTGSCPIVDSDGREIRRSVTWYKNVFLRHYSFPLYLTQNFISCPATFVRRSVLDDIGPFRLDLHYSMDYDAFLRVARRGAPIVLDRDLAVFTMVEGTKSMSGFEEQFQEHHQLAREHGAGHPLAVAVNAAASGAIVAIYRTMRFLRGRRPVASRQA
jgi:glycosyltransferase involved in cell wall biosynthesis